MLKKTYWLLTFIILPFWLIGSSAWAALALYFGDSSQSLFQLVFAIIMTLTGLTATIALFFILSCRKWLLLIHSIFFLMVIIYWFNIQPRNDRDWQMDVSKLAYASSQDHLITLHNIRNFKYRSEYDYQPEYYDKTFDLNSLEGADVFAVYWMGPSIAHVIMSFDFGEDNHLAISIEARKEEAEGYSTIKGFFRQYELIYIVADERDIIGLRTHYRKNPPEQVYRYRLKIPLDNIRRLFVEYINSINTLSKSSAFYNTLLANCTSIIWLHNKVNPEYLPFSWKILLSGYVPEYLYESGRLDQNISFSKLRDQAHTNPLVEGQAISAHYSSIIRP